ncbi:MAG: hypothetical protein ACI8SN_002655 [Algoriphagus sp.]|jgi:hypothetical protein
MSNWLEEIEILLKSKTANFSTQEKENIQFEYLKNLLEKIESEKLVIEPALQTKIEYVINEIPIKTTEKRIDYKSKHINELSNLQTIITQKFNFVKKGQYTRRYMPLGTVFGMSFGVPIAAAISKIALGPIIALPIGMIVGLLIGNRLDKKARNENRVL